jgi:two-component system sensor histidine kinase/response regulator
MRLAVPIVHSRKGADWVVQQRDDGTTAPQDPIDALRLLRQVEGDLDLLQEIASLFLADYPRRLSELKDAVARGDSDAVLFAAHSIKGSVATLAAQPCYEAAKELEEMGGNGDLTGAAAACAALQAEIERLETALEGLARLAGLSSVQS